MELNDQQAAQQETKTEPPVQQTTGQEPLVQALQAALQPLQQTVLTLQDQQKKLQEQLTSQQQAARSQLLAEQTDLRSLLDEAGDLSAEGEDKYSKLSPKQMVEAVCTAVETAMRANNERLKDELGTTAQPSNDRLDRMEKAVMTVIANIGVTQARSRFKDFDEHKEDISDVMKMYPGIQFDHAYMLAKSIKASTTPPASVTETEKPSSVVTRPTEQEIPAGASRDEVLAARGRSTREGSPRATGIVDFRNALDQSIDRILSSIPGV